MNTTRSRINFPGDTPPTSAGILYTMKQGTRLTNTRKPAVPEREHGTSGNRLLFGDCLNLINDIDTHSVDLIATDPPYGIGFGNNPWDSKNIPDWDILAEEFHRVLKPSGNLIIFQGWSNVMKTHAKLDAYFELKIGLSTTE